MKSVDEIEPEPERNYKNRRVSSELGILQQDPLKRVGDVLAPVGGVFEQLIELAPAQCLDQRGHLGDALIERGERRRQRVVGFVFEPVELFGRVANLGDVGASVVSIALPGR